jgi:hypothetical protein
MAYSRKYKIVPGVQGFWVFENNEVWSQLKVFPNKEEAEAAIKRAASADVYYYDENGEAV